MPLWLKVGYSVWLVAWFCLYAHFYRMSHFLWMCHVGNVVLAAALWLESPLLFSWQAVSLLFVHVFYTVDVAGRAVLGWHPIGGTEYMFMETLPREQRLLSLFHMLMPVLLIWALRRFGYDRRAIWLQIATCWVLYPLSYLLGREEDNLNYVRGFLQVQTSVSPPLYLLAAIILHPLVLYVPSHVILAALVRRPDHRRTVAGAPEQVGTEVAR